MACVLCTHGVYLNTVRTMVVVGKDWPCPPNIGCAQIRTCGCVRMCTVILQQLSVLRCVRTCYVIPSSCLAVLSASSPLWHCMCVQPQCAHRAHNEHVLQCVILPPWLSLGEGVLQPAKHPCQEWGGPDDSVGSAGRRD